MNELFSCSLSNFFNQPRRHCEFHTPAQNQSPLGAPPDTFYTECKLANTRCIEKKKTARRLGTSQAILPVGKGLFALSLLPSAITMLPVCEKAAAVSL